MEKVLLAVGYRKLEEYLEKNLKKEFLFVGSTVYREGVIRAIGQKNPDIIVIRETLDGSENIMSIIYEIRSKYPNTRIIFVAGKREPGDELLATLVNYGIYDILQGEKIPANQIIALIRKPNEYKDVKHLQPVPILDEQRNRMLFQPPEAIQKETVTEVYIEKETQIHNKSNDDIFLKKQNHDIKEDDSPVPNKKGILSKLPNVMPEKKDNFLKPKEKKNKATDKIVDSDNMFKLPLSNIESSAQKIITFIGGRSGVGTTSLAINTAISLAKRGKKVIFIEFNDNYPAASYWYEMGFLEDGIDSCIEALSQNKYEKINEAIISVDYLVKKEGALQNNYKKFPKTLDFLFFSQKYLSEGFENPLDMSLSKELYLYLMFQIGYDYVVLDVPHNIKNQATLNALIYSNKIFTILSQDVSSVGYHILKMHELEKQGILLKNKNYYVINRFEKADLNLKEIQDWLETENILTLSDYNKDFINANFIGLPVSLYSKNPQLKSSLLKIESIIK